MRVVLLSLLYGFSCVMIATIISVLFAAAYLFASEMFKVSEKNSDKVITNNGGAKFMRTLTWKPTADSSSSFIKQIDYDHGNQNLTVQIKNANYVYRNVPAKKAMEFVTADSKGQYFHANIKDAYLYNVK